ncbi:MAG: hypothetical protein KDD64_02965 [Bdellovibrionales bacterium]|nr:hypothetical protein [Bdellovibrionales bacterium]
MSLSIRPENLFSSQSLSPRTGSTLLRQPQGNSDSALSFLQGSSQPRPGIENLVQSISNSLVQAIEQIVSRVVEGIMTKLFPESSSQAGALDNSQKAPSSLSEDKNLSQCQVGSSFISGGAPGRETTIGGVVDSLLESVNKLFDFGKGIFGGQDSFLGTLGSLVSGGLFDGGLGVVGSIVEKGGDFLSKGFKGIKKAFGF